jgi:hypothetical protein
MRTFTYCRQNHADNLRQDHGHPKSNDDPYNKKLQRDHHKVADGTRTKMEREFLYTHIKRLSGEIKFIENRSVTKVCSS